MYKVVILSITLFFSIYAPPKRSIDLRKAAIVNSAHSLSQNHVFSNMSTIQSDRDLCKQYIENDDPRPAFNNLISALQNTRKELLVELTSQYFPAKSKIEMDRIAEIKLFNEKEAVGWRICLELGSDEFTHLIKYLDAYNLDEALDLLQKFLKDESAFDYCLIVIES